MRGEEALALIAELRAQNALLSAQMAEEQQRNTLLGERIRELEQKVAELEARKTPPPPWAKANRVRPAGAENKTRTKRASTHDHGRQRSTPTRIERQAYERCPDCGYALRGEAIKRRREVIELPAVGYEVVEHQLIKRHCPVCRAWKTPRVCFAGITLGQSRIGVRLASLIGTLRTTGRLPLAAIQAHLAQVYGLTLSEGGIQGILGRLAAALAPVRTRIAHDARGSPARHMDETGWREGGQNGYLWVQATDGPAPTRQYTYDRRRAGAIARDLAGTEDAGVLVTDFYAAYDHLPGAKQRCWAHLLRDIHALGAAHPARADVQDWVQAVKGLYKRARALDTTTLTTRERARLADECERRSRALARCYRRTDGHPAQVLARRLHRYESELFTFVRLPGVPATNNEAERAVRPLVITRKISGGSRSSTGSQVRCDLATPFYTWAARGLNPFAACLAALQSP
jgi:transposase